MREEKMKKQLIVLFTLVAVSVISFTSCEPFIENKITAINNADYNVTLNLRGKVYPIPAGESLILNDFKKGSFDYSTFYDVPDGLTPAAEGDVAGTFVLNAGTELLLVYTSITEVSSYTIYRALSSSDDVNRVDPFDDGETP